MHEHPTKPSHTPKIPAVEFVYMNHEGQGNLMASPAESMDENEVTLFFGDDISDGDIAIESPTIEATIPEDEDLFVKNADTEEFSDIFSGTGAGIDDFDIVAGEPPHASEAENDNDIACMIPGLYRMLYLRKDNGVNGLVDKVILSREAMESFCNDVIPGSFQSITEVDYTKLCQESLHYIGVYGNPGMIVNLLFRIKAISEDIETLLRSQCETQFDNSKQVSPSLSAGIYLYHDKPSGCGLVIHWPEHGAFMENASSDKKKNMINFQRYLCKLTNRQVCLMTKSDVASFKWKDENMNNDENFFGNDQGDSICFEFEVQKNQEQKEDFDFREGFQVRIPGPILHQESPELAELDLRPEIVESIHHQTLVTKRLLPAIPNRKERKETLYEPGLRQRLQQLLPNSKLILSETMSLAELTILVDHIDLPQEVAQQFAPTFKDPRQDMEQFKEQKRKIEQDTKQDIKLVSQWAIKHLLRFIQELYPTMTKAAIESGEARLIDKQDIPSTHCNAIEKKLREHLSFVDHALWKQRKKRLFFSLQIAYIVWKAQCAETELSRNETASSVIAAQIRIFYNIFMDKERNLRALAQNYIPQKKSSWSAFIRSKLTGDPFDTLMAEMAGSAGRAIQTTPDPELLEVVRRITEPKSTNQFFFTDVSNDDIDLNLSHEFMEMAENLQNMFVEPLERWAESPLLKDGIKQLIDHYLNNKAFETLKEMKITAESDIAAFNENERIRIREILMAQYDYGDTLNVLRVKQHPRGNYTLEYVLNTSIPPKMRLYFHETQLDQSDIQDLETEAIDDESYRPTPQLYSYGAHRPPTLEYYPHTYSMRKIYQLENGKILCFLHNNRNHSTEVYYDKVPRIGSTVSNGISLKKFSRSFQFTAFEDVNGLLALYSTENGTLHVYSFDEKRRELSVRRANIQILPWYNNVAPKLSQILFINGTEDLCFVETSGHVRVYSLVTEQFQPADGKFPRNSEVRCSPDGTCLIAFAGKPNDSEDEMEDTFAGNFESDPLYASSEYSDDEDETLATNVEPSAIDHQFLNPRAGSIATKHLLNESTNSFADRNSSAKSSRWEGADAGDVDAHVYFLTNLNVARKIVRLHAVGDIRAIKLSLLAGLQTHLIYITSSYEYFASNILKITIERNEWRFNESNKTTINLGKVRASATFIQGNQAIDGNGTQFFNIEPDDLLVVRGEKRPVKEVLSATRLIVEGAFEGIADGFLDFKIERRPNSNAYVDCYSNMYQRYPVDSCIKDDSEMSVPLANDLQIVLGISKEHVKGNEYPDRFSKHAKDAFDELIKMTNKPASALRHFTTSVQSIEELDIIKLCKLSAARPIGHWLIQMSCLLPIQIAVAMEGYFVPLKDGVITDMDSNLGGAVNLTSISEAITFGWYESVYNFYGDREVKVVSSMGEQSTGKSYILNHLCGSTFEGSAQRCTEGVWMSLVPTRTTLYVVMDFEGLRSLERTPQEDMLLTLFNAAISNLILYKNNFALGRDISSMFHSFQDGATTFDPSNTANMFTARLAIVIKDVPKQDRAGIVQEFKSKFAKIVSSEGDNNFISRLYQGQMSILPWPIFNEPGFYTALTDLKRYLDASKPKFGTARIFLPTVKTIMAKLKVCDWSSLDDNMVRNRALTTRFLIKQVIATGMEEVEPTIEPLKNRESGAIIEDKPATFLDVFGELEMAFDDHEIMPDSGFILLSESNILFRDLSSQVRSFFESNAQERSTALEDAEWYELYTTFVEFIVDRRIGRARQWFSVNTARFPSDHTEIAAASYELEQESEKLVATWSLCGLTCATCNLRCLDQSDHLDEHDCFTNHYCHHNCYFAEEHNLAHETSEAIQIPLCKLLAGHDGFHVCRDSDHLCGESCALYGRSNCQSTCTKPIGHEDESHQCASRIHYCGEPCSLRDVKDSKAGSQFSCNNACTVSYGEPHEIHQCENDTACPLRCCMPQCNKKCSSTDHFHALNNLAEHHICGEEHQCFEECECDGICEIKIQPQAQEESYVNKHGTFTYTKWEQTSKRITCYMKIPAGQLTHTGKHVHAPIDNIFHFCQKKCPYCAYYCTLPYGHRQVEHDTSHGNMIQTVFSAVDDEFEHEGFKFNTGDRGSAFLCKMFCKSLGRHRHVDYCKSEEHASCNTEGTQHITKRIDPNPDRAKDYVKHALYWKRTGFKDPYTKEEQEIFGKCDALCCSEEHQLKANQNASGTGGDGAMNFVAPTKSYCELPIFHSPFPRGTAPPNGVGYVSADGHHFKCRNPAGASSSFHIIFAVDRSASMKNKDVRPLHHSPIANLLRPRHDNRLGAVYDAVYRFMEARQTTSRNRAAGGSELTSNDRVSLLLFNEKATTVFVNRPIVEHTELMAEMLKYHAMEGTFFGAGIRRATEILVQHHDPSRIPFIIFLSDGGSNYPRKELQQLFQSAVRVGAMPFLSTVLFGCGAKTNDSMLKSISDFADNQHKLRANPQQQGTSNEKLRCQFYNALDTIQLVEHFTGIAQSLKEHKPALLQG